MLDEGQSARRRVAPFAAPVTEHVLPKLQFPAMRAGRELCQVDAINRPAVQTNRFDNSAAVAGRYTAAMEELARST